MRISAIDIGTNTVLLLVADVRGGTLRPIEHGHSIARLGQGVDEHRTIEPEAMDRVGKVLEEYVAVSKAHSAEQIVVCGTSALRDAHNRDEFLRYVRKRFGFNVKILSGKEEAELTYIGALSEFPNAGLTEHAVIDIGGGSTEVIVGTGLVVKESASLDIGCVRLTEKFLKNSPPDQTGIDKCILAIQKNAASLPIIGPAARIIGVAGTVTTLAALDLNLPTYDPLRVSGHVLSLNAIQRQFNQLRLRTLDEIRSIPQIHTGRADIILAGIIILIELMNRIGRSEITVSDRGLRYGFALREAR